MKDEECIWVSRESSEKWKRLKSEGAKRDQQEKVLDEYMQTVNEAVKRDFRSNLEGLDEDAAIFTGIVLKTRQAFEKAKNEHLDASYALWEKFDAEIPSVKKKTDEIVAALKPILDLIKEIEAGLKNIDTARLDRFLDGLRIVASFYGQERTMLEFLVNNFKKDEQ